MANETFYVKIETPKGTGIYSFTRSETGILDYAGESNPEADELAQMQCVEGSAYFTPSWYSFLPRELQAEISVYLPAEIANMDAGQYSFLLHVGAILLAVRERDGLLLAELLRRRSTVFANFLPLVLHIVKPIAAEALFVNVFGGLRGDSGFEHVYKANAMISTGETDVSSILFAAARDALKPEPQKESLEEMFVRYFAENRHFDFTIGIVGATNHPWVSSLEKVDDAIDGAVVAHFADDISKVGQKRYELYASLASKVQAEPYNPHDHNAISVSIEDPGKVFKGIRSKSKAGYLRATAAAILRQARPNLFAYGSSLWRLGANPDYFENAIVLRLKF